MDVADGDGAVRATVVEHDDAKRVAPRLVVLRQLRRYEPLRQVVATAAQQQEAGTSAEARDVAGSKDEFPSVL